MNLKLGQKLEDYPLIRKGDKLSFGKYEGREVNKVLIQDQIYLKWIIDNTDIIFEENLETEIELRAEAQEGDEDYEWE